jgi:hypothetical protein
MFDTVNVVQEDVVLLVSIKPAENPALVVPDCTVELLV